MTKCKHCGHDQQTGYCGNSYCPGNNWEVGEANRQDPAPEAGQEARFVSRANQIMESHGDGTFSIVPTTDILDALNNQSQDNSELVGLLTNAKNAIEWFRCHAVDKTYFNGVASEVHSDFLEELTKAITALEAGNE